MKKNLLILCSLLVGLTFVACSSDDDENKGNSSASTLTVKNATYNEGAFPAATVSERLEGVKVSNTSDADNATIQIPKDDEYTRFSIGIKGQSGYYVYTPNDTRASDEDEYWEIPITFDKDEIAGKTVQVSAEDIDGNITKPYEFTLNYTDSKSRANFSIVYNGEAMFSCEYDEKGRLVHFRRMNGDYYAEEVIITYNGNQPTKIFYRENDFIVSEDSDDYTATYTSITTNKQGYITGMKGEHVFGGKASYDNYSSTHTFDYDGNGYLVKQHEVFIDRDGSSEDAFSYTWSNGNLVSVKLWESDSETRATDDGPHEYENLITYGEDVNKLEQGSYGQFYSSTMEWVVFTNLCGKHSKNLPISYKSISRGKHYDGEEWTFDYEFNSDGSIKTETVNGRHKLEYVYGN